MIQSAFRNELHSWERVLSSSPVPPSLACLCRPSLSTPNHVPTFSAASQTSDGYTETLLTRSLRSISDLMLGAITIESKTDILVNQGTLSVAFSWGFEMALVFRLDT